MNNLTGRLAAVYAWLLKLYPRTYQSEFAEERQEVFAQTLSETAAKGKWALTLLMVRELRDLPGSVFKAKFREWEETLKRLETDFGKERLSWTGIFIGVWPYLFLGPVMAVAPYLPRQIAEFFGYSTPVWLSSGRVVFNHRRLCRLEKRFSALGLSISGSPVFRHLNSNDKSGERAAEIKPTRWMAFPDDPMGRICGNGCGGGLLAEPHSFHPKNTS